MEFCIERNIYKYGNKTRKYKVTVNSFGDINTLSFCETNT